MDSDDVIINTMSVNRFGHVIITDALNKIKKLITWIKCVGTSQLKHLTYLTDICNNLQAFITFFFHSTNISNTLYHILIH